MMDVRQVRGGSDIAVYIRVLQSDQVEETIRSALSQLKKIDILVNGEMSHVTMDHVVL